MSIFGSMEIIRYGDYIVREFDMEKLRDHKPMNDILVGFYCSYLSKEVFPEEKTKIKIISPGTTHLIKVSCPEYVPNLLGDISETQFVFFPVNNIFESDRDLRNHLHWSLLVYSRAENVLAHFDSAAGRNTLSAQNLCRQLMHAITPTPTFSSRGCFPQKRANDCGLHVLSNIRIIATHVGRYKLINGTTTAKADTAAAHRLELNDLIEWKCKAPAGDN